MKLQKAIDDLDDSYFLVYVNVGISSLYIEYERCNGYKYGK
ncbi:hypothetical protein SAMN05660236_1427 [Ohtaekwangia koreensis]|uniref:Uncharacterized protein n=1 Tax=Ohtaekwangia koreensis TaxID=688867 RepID=A0A1T5JS02_9BACT|nr:hypothetical protein SAMN05660236_1427 [Ohtaekwangia koreensis]